MFALAGSRSSRSATISPNGGIREGSRRPHSLRVRQQTSPARTFKHLVCDCALRDVFTPFRPTATSRAHCSNFSRNSPIRMGTQQGPASLSIPSRSRIITEPRLKLDQLRSAKQVEASVTPARLMSTICEISCVIFISSPRFDRVSSKPNGRSVVRYAWTHLTVPCARLDGQESFGLLKQQLLAISPQGALQNFVPRR